MISTCILQSSQHIPSKGYFTKDKRPCTSFYSVVSCVHKTVMSGGISEVVKKAHPLQKTDDILQDNNNRRKIGYSGLLPSESHDNIEKSKFCSFLLIQFGQKGKK